MSKSIILKNNTFWDSKGIVYNKEKLSDILDIKTISLNFNSDYVYSTDLEYMCVKIGKLVILNIRTIAFKQAVPNYQIFITDLPKPINGYSIFYLYGGSSSACKMCRCALTSTGNIQIHWGSPSEFGNSSNAQYGGTIIYKTNE